MVSVLKARRSRAFLLFLSQVSAMQLSQILSVDRVFIDPNGSLPDATAVLRKLSELISLDGACNEEEVFSLLQAREQLLSTGIGDAVAIPHTPVPDLTGQRAALVLSVQGVDFAAIDGEPVRIFFAVTGPKSAASEHLKILAKLSRLLKSPETRRRLLESREVEQAYSLIEEQEASAR